MQYKFHAGTTPAGRLRADGRTREAKSKRKRDGMKERETRREKETVGPPHRRNNLSESVSRPRKRLCMIYSHIRRSVPGEKRRWEGRGDSRGMQYAGEKVERREQGKVRKAPVAGQIHERDTKDLRRGIQERKREKER